ncbi:MAG: DNA polymerase III subunit alpha [Brevefilum sp.]|jgi:DNA polymerase-3 subunit alpha
MTFQNKVFIRTHSYYSFLESLLSPQEVVNYAAQNQIRTLGLIDYRYLTGAIPFYEACTSAGIKPILGLEIDCSYTGFDGRLALLAKDRQGWGNLCRLSSMMLIDDKAIDINTLNRHNEGIVCLIGSPRGILTELILNSPSSENLPNRLIEEIKAIFQNRVFFEIQRYENGPVKLEHIFLGLAKSHRLPIIASQDTFYGSKKDDAIHRTLFAIKTNKPIQQLSGDDLSPYSAHFPNWEGFVYRYHDLPEAIHNLSHIHEQCTLTLPIGQTHYPVFPVPDGQSQSEFLRTKAYAGARSIFGKITPEITNRLDYELETISTLGYEPIFLIVEDILNHARQLDIPISSRGSAASSLVAHCLKITSPDPLALNLYFERFLNPARKKPPDIDTDIASHRRDEVIQYVFERYGSDKVAMVGTINRYRPKSAFGDVARAYGLTPETIRQLSKRLPSSFGFKREEEALNPFSGLIRDSSIPVLKDIVADAVAILDLPRHLSIHPGGIVIAPFPITDLIPLAHSTSLGINHTQFDLDQIEKLGMVKIDLLGIKGLTVLGEVADRIHAWKSKDFSSGLDVLQKIPMDDLETSKRIQEAATIGCFQVESPGMRATLREIKAKTVEDIMAALALYRPGPLRGGLRDAFVRRFKGEESVAHIHPSLSNLLDDTFGVILYQEQVLRIAHELGGLSIAEADILRRAMSHFDPGGVMDTLRANFVSGADKSHNIPDDVAGRIWEMMAAFAGYGFPKAHAASYAQLAWNSAWCKTHFPAEFMSAVLGFGGGYYSQRVYLMEARRMKLPVLPPHINHSARRFCVRYPDGEPTLYMGLGQVRDLSQRTINRIQALRPFTSLEDFIIRADPQRKEAEHLIMCGGLEGLTSIPEGLALVSQKRPSGQLSLFDEENQIEEWTLEQQITAQQEILGVNLASSPLELLTEQIQQAGAITTLEAINYVGEKVCVAGMRQTLRRFKTKANQMMGALNLEDLEGSLQVVIAPRLFQQNFAALQEAGPFLVEGVIEEDLNRNQIRMIAEKVTLIK